MHGQREHDLVMLNHSFSHIFPQPATKSNPEPKKQPKQRFFTEEERDLLFATDCASIIATGCLNWYTMQPLCSRFAAKLICLKLALV